MSRVVLIVYLFILYASLSKSGMAQKAKNRKFIIYASIGFIIDSGLRHLCIGPDTYQYYLMFEDANMYSYSELFNSIFRRGSFFYIKDAGYWLFMRLFQVIFPSYRLFLVFIAILFFTALGRLVYKNLDNLKDIFISYLFYLGMYWYFFSTTGCRQTIAVSLLMLAFPLLVDGKFIKYTIVVLLAAMLHTSAISALLGLLLVFIHSKKFFNILVVILVPLIFLARNVIFVYLLDSFNMKDIYGVYIGSGESFASIIVTMFYLVILVLCLVYHERLSASKSMDYCMKLYYFGMCLLPTMFISATAMRITFYFTYTMYLIVPSLLKQVKLANKYFFAILLMLSLSYFSIRQTWDYKFFWQSAKVTHNGRSFIYHEELPFDEFFK